MTHRPALLALVATLAAAVAVARSDTPDSGVVERAERRLAQIDVSVTGPPESIVGLTAADFDVVVAGEPIAEIVVDEVCDPSAFADDDEAGRTARDERTTAAPAPAPATAGATLSPTYLFYFDQHHLTPLGRQNSIEYARDLVGRLITGGEDGPRAVIVSAGERLTTFAQPTRDPGVLLDALDRLEHDRRQWDPYPYQEDLRIQEIVKSIDDQDPEEVTVALARRHQREEAWHTDKALRLFSFVLGRLAVADPPKIALYFADTMRREPGAHYTSFVGGRASEFGTAGNSLRAMELSAFGSTGPFDRLLETAAAHGVRVYPVEGRGLTTISSTVRSQRPGSGSPVANRRGMVDAEDSLTALALETGGRAFLNGVPAKKMAAAIRRDLGCMYLISFDAADLKRDVALPVRVRVGRDDVEVQSRGQLVIQSEERRSLSKLMAAYAGGADDDETNRLHAVVMPGTFEDGAYRGLSQIVLPPSPVPRPTWEVGVVVVSDGRVLDETTRSVSVSAPGVPIVVERMVDFRPGPYELIAVARETASGRVVSARIEDEWPKSLDRSIFLGPFATVQPRRAAFVRGDDVEDQGALGAGPGRAVRPDLPTALLGLVCRGSSRATTVLVERSLVGVRTVDFDPLEIDLASDRCVQIRDLIPADTMTAGAFSYDVRASSGGRELAAASFPFYALESGTDAGEPAAGTGS